MQWNIDSLAMPYSSADLSKFEAGKSWPFFLAPGKKSRNKDVIDRLKMFSFALESEVLMIAIYSYLTMSG